MLVQLNYRLIRLCCASSALLHEDLRINVNGSREEHRAYQCVNTRSVVEVQLHNHSRRRAKSLYRHQDIDLVDDWDSYLWRRR